MKDSDWKPSDYADCPWEWQSSEGVRSDLIALLKIIVVFVLPLVGFNVLVIRCNPDRDLPLQHPVQHIYVTNGQYLEQYDLVRRIDLRKESGSREYDFAGGRGIIRDTIFVDGIPAQVNIYMLSSASNKTETEQTIKKKR